MKDKIKELADYAWQNGYACRAYRANNMENTEHRQKAFESFMNTQIDRYMIDKIQIDGEYVIVTWKDGSTSRVLAK